MNTIIKWGGYIGDGHNFNNNPHFKHSFIDELIIQGILNTTDVHKKMFRFNQLEISDYSGYDASLTKHIDIMNPLPTRKFVSSLITKRYEDTIKENLDTLEHMILSVRQNYPKCKIYLILIPRFFTMEIALAPHLKRWKEEFYKYMRYYVEKYKCEFIDFKTESKISNNAYFYNDVNHLNIIGARAFSCLLLNRMNCRRNYGKGLLDNRFVGSR